MIQAAIDIFEPAWEPPAGQLRGVIVLVNPAGGGPEPLERRRNDELCLRTAQHLYHLIKHAGGNAILTRIDDRPLVTGRDDAPAALAARARQTRAHLLVTIDAGRSPPPSPSPAPVAPLARSLTDALAEVVRTPLVLPAQVADLRLSAVSVHLPALAETSPPARQSSIHRAYAEAIYRGIAVFARTHHGESDAAGLDQRPEPEPPEPEPLPDDEPQVHTPRKFQRLARAIWPVGDLPADRAPWFASIFRKIALSAASQVYFEPRVSVEGGTVFVRGATANPRLLRTVEHLLAAVGVKNVRSDMRLLPDEARLGGGLFGACRAPTALTFSEPGETGVPMTQLLFGEPVFLLDEQDGFLLVQASDGYWGWVRRDCVQAMDRDRFNAYTRGAQAVLLDDLDLEDLRIPRGSRLPIDPESSGELTLVLPDGRRRQVPSGRARRLDPLRVLEDRAQAALTMLHTPYVFGGRSPAGVDCSGLITSVCEREGLPMARDAAQQVLGGKLVATAWYRDDIRPGDRLYFVDETGKVSHSGIALSATHFVHASPPEVQISSLRKGDRLYDEGWDRSFLAAKRP